MKYVWGNTSSSLMVHIERNLSHYISLVVICHLLFGSNLNLSIGFTQVIRIISELSEQALINQVGQLLLVYFWKSGEIKN